VTSLVLAARPTFIGDYHFRSAYCACYYQEGAGQLYPFLVGFLGAFTYYSNSPAQFTIYNVEKFTRHFSSIVPHLAAALSGAAMESKENREIESSSQTDMYSTSYTTFLIGNLSTLTWK
jgi:hypothetical protein